MLQYPGADTGGPITRAGAHDAAQHELSRGEYHRDDPSLLQRLLNWLTGRLGHILRVADHAPGGIAGIVILIALVVVVVIAVRVKLGRLPVRDLFTDRSPGGGRRTADELRADADALAAQEKWADAVRVRTRAIIRELESRGVVDPRPGTTLTALTRQAARRLPTVAADLRLVARLFDEVWYANLPATADTDARLRAADARIGVARASADPTAPLPVGAP